MKRTEADPVEILAHADLLLLAARMLRVHSPEAVGAVTGDEANELAVRSRLADRSE